MTGVGSMQQGAIKARKGTELGNAQEIQCDRPEAVWQGGGAGSVLRSHQARWPSVNAILRKSALYFCLRCEALAAPKPPRNRECPSSSPRRALSVPLLAAASDAFDANICGCGSLPPRWDCNAAVNCPALSARALLESKTNC